MNLVAIITRAIGGIVNMFNFTIKTNHSDGSESFDFVSMPKSMPARAKRTYSELTPPQRKFMLSVDHMRGKGGFRVCSNKDWMSREEDFVAQGHSKVLYALADRGYITIREHIYSSFTISVVL